MDCSRIHDIVQEYLDGRLATLERNEFVWHVSECAACEQEVIRYRDLFAGLRRVERVEAPDRLARAVMAHVHAERLVRPTAVSRRRRLVEGFLELPTLVKYPLAAASVVAAVYVPLSVGLSLVRGSVAPLTAGLADAAVFLRGLVSHASVVEDTATAAAGHFHVVRAVIAALAGSPMAEMTGVALGATLAAVGAIVLVLRASRRRRSPHDGTFILSL